MSIERAARVAEAGSAAGGNPEVLAMLQLALSQMGGMSAGKVLKP
jgi:hypothetical protein